MPRPKRWRSSYGLEVSVSSCSQPLQEPASTCRSARLRPRSGAASAMLVAEAAEVAEQGQHQRSGAGVAELEALVDEREVGQQVAGRGVRDGGPVRVRAGAEPEPLDAVAVSARRRSTSRRAGSRRGRCRRPLAARAALPPRLDRPVEQPSSELEATAASSSARCSSRACTSPAGRSGTDGIEAVVGERGSRSRDVVARARPRARPARRCRAARRPPRRRTPMSGSRSWKEALNRSSRQPRRASARSASSSSRAARTARARASSSLPPTRTLPKRKRWPVSAALSRRARSVSAANRLLPAARPTPAQTAAMSFRWLQIRSSSSRIVRARASSGGRREAERLLARVRVRDARS